MKKLLFALLAFMPMVGLAQNVWEVPENTSTKKEEVKKVEKKKSKPVKAEDAKYLAGAVPVVDGHVVFTLDKDVPGMSADEIYNRMYVFIDSLTREENQFDVSKIAAVNKTEHTIAARFKEWLVFQSSFLSLDRTEFNYTLISRCSDGHVTLTLERISYQYEMDRGDNSGLQTSADDWITDKYALNKKGTKLARYSGKFRRKTIDRKDNIFSRACEALGVQY
ncbi:MAG: DUF4468 domain-containing protein [Prevotella sp.]|jgi:hypothetical protein